MKSGYSLTIGLLAASLSFKATAGTFSDSLSSGIDSSFWTVETTTSGLYSTTTSASGVTFSLPDASKNPGGLQGVALALNLGNVSSGPLGGDFTAQVSFLNANIGPQNDQVQLNVDFSDGSQFYDCLDLTGGSKNYHVFSGAVQQGHLTSATSGTFTVARSGSTLTGYFDGNAFFSKTGASLADISNISLNLQNNSSIDQPSVTFNDFSLTASSVPEPTSLALAGLGGLAVLFYRRQK